MYEPDGLRRGLQVGFLTLGSLLTASCAGRIDSAATPPNPPHFRSLDPVDEANLRTLVEVAEASSSSSDAHLEAGLALAHATLKGHLRYRDRAEHHLHRAQQLDPDSQLAARVLGRFLNMRSSVLDASKIELQIALYESVLDERKSRGPNDMEAVDFHAHSFVLAARALKAYREGHPGRAVLHLKRLERRMRSRLHRHPDEIDTYAMAGNFEAASTTVPTPGRRARVRRATRYLSVQRDRWDEQSEGARDVAVAPNVQTVFAFALAELRLASGDTTLARRDYEAVLALDVPDTKARRQIEALSLHRLEHLSEYAGDEQLLPPWPQGITSCVACHSTTTSLPATGLHLMAGARLWGSP